MQNTISIWALRIVGVCTALIGIVNGVSTLAGQVAHWTFNFTAATEAFGMIKVGIPALIAALAIQHAPALKVLALEAQSRMLLSLGSRGLRDEAIAHKLQDKALEIKL